MILRTLFFRLFLLAVGGLPAGCADRLVVAESIAAPTGLRRMTFPGATFTLTGWGRLTAAGQPVNIYIEGDGPAWLSRTTPSPDPTPSRPLGLALAAADTASNVVYLARPCQFTPPADNPACGVAYWTGKRFAPEVVSALDQAVDRIVAQTGAKDIHLTGYSGGGAIATLLAARRGDVASLRTVAGNLDHHAVNRLHNVTPLAGSLNAIDVAAATARIPQIHYSGGKDAVVPPEIAARFAAAVGGSCVLTVTEAGFDHENGWREAWPGLAARRPACLLR